MKYEKIRKRIIALYSIVSIIILISIFSQSKEINEFILKYVYNPLAYVFGSIYSFFPFSVFELLACIGAVVLVCLIIKIIIKLSKKQKFEAFITSFSTVILILCVISSYMFMTSFIYNRKELPFDVYQDKNLTSVENAFSNYYEDLIYCSDNIKKDEFGSISPYDDEEIKKLLIKEYDKLSSKSDYFIKKTMTPKPIAFSFLMSEFNITGITFLPTFEPCYNEMTPTFSKVFTIAHEMAHSKGIMVENEANVIAAYILLNSDDIYLRYCGYYATLSSVYDSTMKSVLAFLKPEYYDLENKKILIPEVMKLDSKRSYNFWKKYDNLDKIGNFFNDIYLKLNGQSGVSSYQTQSNSKVEYSENNEIESVEIKEFNKMQKFILQLYV